ncbi:hypothetical protein [Streptomyces buecherae]|uniref:hypothetical protein n=1 Tax=Streptomyces buecherae TaxID=2763006 RepID=UPI001C27D906|nr:hypothetical protein [Streptomyces buecherae]
MLRPPLPRAVAGPAFAESRCLRGPSEQGGQPAVREVGQPRSARLAWWALLLEEVESGRRIAVVAGVGWRRPPRDLLRDVVGQLGLRFVRRETGRPFPSSQLSAAAG